MFNTIFQAAQLSIEILTETNTIHKYIPNLTWFCTHPLSVFIFVQFIVKREQLWFFFEDWRCMENHNTISSHLEFKNIANLKHLIVSLNWFMYLSITCVACCLILYRPEASYLLSHYEQLRDVLGLPFVIIFHSTSVMSTFISEPLSGAVPGFVFYHAGQILRSIKCDIEHTFIQLTDNSNIKMLSSSARSTFQIQMHAIFLRYEILSKLVKRANKLFGALMIFNHATLLFMIVVLLYSIFHQIQRSRIDALIFFSAIIPYSYLLLINHLLSAQLSSASSKLKFTLSSMMARNCLRLTKEDLSIASIFLSHLQEDKLAARPLNLYSINNSSILTLTSIIISYVMVLLQA